METSFPKSDRTENEGDSRQREQQGHVNKEHGEKTLLEMGKGLNVDLWQPRRPLEAAGVAARLDGITSSAGTQQAGGELFSELSY